MAVSIDNAVRLGIKMPVYQHALRSMYLATQPSACPRPETTVSSSQCPNVSLLRTSFGRFEMGVSILNHPLVSRGF